MTGINTEGVISDLTEEHLASGTRQGILVETEVVTTSHNGGHKKGSMKEKKKEDKQKVAGVTSQCATMFSEKLKEARNQGLCNVPNGALKKLINEEEEKAGLSVKAILLDNIRMRVKGGNPKAVTKSKQSPISELEPIICEFFICLAKMGRLLTKTTVIELANDLIVDTEFKSKVEQFKLERKLNHLGKLSDAWYHGFLQCCDNVLAQNGSAIKDTERRAWVSMDNFKNMYENVYERMVEAGMAEKEVSEINYETGLPYKYRLNLPELLFVC